jgi:hypothetical protein
MRNKGIVAGVVVFIALAVAPLANAANRSSFNDDALDNQGHGTAEYASDIRTVEVVTDDRGDMTFRVTLTTEGSDEARLYPDDRVRIQVDSDRNQQTGVGGYELELRASGTSAGTPTFEFCVVDRRLGIFSCQAGTEGNYSQTAAGTNTYLLSFSFRHPWSLVNFRVVTEYRSRFDSAPNAGLWTYQTLADPDRDGIYGYGDDCPTRSTLPAGVSASARSLGLFDSDLNGCPGPYRRLPVPAYAWNAFAFGNGIRITAFRIINAPSGTSVTVRAGGRAASRRGAGRVAGLANRFVAVGSTVSITFRAAGRCTSTRTLRVVRTPRAYNIIPYRLTFSSPVRGARCR